MPVRGESSTNIRSVEEISNISTGLGAQRQHQVRMMHSLRVLNILKLDNDTIVVKDNIGKEARNLLQLPDNVINLTCTSSLHDNNTNNISTSSKSSQKHIRQTVTYRHLSINFPKQQKGFMVKKYDLD
jgi:hypothetical protein